MSECLVRRSMVDVRQQFRQGAGLPPTRITHRTLHRDEGLVHRAQFFKLLEGHMRADGNFVIRRLAAERLSQQGRRRMHFAQALRNVTRQPDGPGDFLKRPENRLPNPPRGVRAESHTHFWIKAFNRPDQTHIAFRNQVFEGNAASLETLGNRDNESQVAFNHAVASGHVAVLHFRT